MTAVETEVKWFRELGSLRDRLALAHDYLASSDPADAYVGRAIVERVMAQISASQHSKHGTMFAYFEDEIKTRKAVADKVTRRKGKVRK